MKLPVPDFRAFKQQVMEGNLNVVLTRYSDIMLAVLVIAIIGIMIIPLPTLLLDVLLATNITIAVVLLMTSLYLPNALSLASFPTIRAWMDRLLDDARRRGYVETLLGRRRKVPDLTSSDNRIRVFAENATLNTPVQGSAADIIKRAMIGVDGWLTASGLDGQLIMQVHDELVLEVAADAVDAVADGVRRIMQGAAALDVPLIVDIGRGTNWDEAH